MIYDEILVKKKNPNMLWKLHNIIVLHHSVLFPVCIQMCIQWRKCITSFLPGVIITMWDACVIDQASKYNSISNIVWIN